MNLEGTWPVHRQGREVGQCRVTRQGLYWYLEAHCAGVGTEIYRLALTGRDTMQSLGIPAPEGGSLTLRKKLAVRSITVTEPFRLELLALDEVWPKPQKEPTPVAEPQVDTAAATPQESPAAPEETTPAASSRPEEPSPVEDVSVPEESAATAEEVTPVEPVTPASAPPEEPVFLPKRPITAETAAPADATKDAVHTESELPPEDAPVLADGVAPEDAAGDVLYSPDKPLPPLENWETLRAVPDGSGGFYLRQIDKI